MVKQRKMTFPRHASKGQGRPRSSLVLIGGHVLKAAKFMQAPGEDIRYLKKGLRYLRGQLDMELVFDFRKPPAREGLYGFFDASHADDVDTRKSTIAYVFFFSGCAISWKTKLHSFVTTSTNHSELVAAAMASREAKFLWKFFGSLNLPRQPAFGITSSVDLFTDSMGVVALSRNSVLSSATKHIEIADFFVRELVERGIVTVAHIPTTSMVADVLTKPLAKLKFFRFISTIMGSTPLDLEQLRDSSPRSDVPGEHSLHILSKNGANAHRWGIRDGQYNEPVPGTGGHGGRPSFRATRGVVNRPSGSTKVAIHPQQCGMG